MLVETKKIVMTKLCLLRQNYFVVTNILLQVSKVLILVAAPSNDRYKGQQTIVERRPNSSDAIIKGTDLK